MKKVPAVFGWPGHFCLQWLMFGLNTPGNRLPFCVQFPQKALSDLGYIDQVGTELLDRFGVSPESVPADDLDASLSDI